METSRDTLVRVEGVSKKYCGSLKGSVLYGVHDVCRDILGLRPTADQLRENEFWALDNVAFEIKRGDCIGLIGANGAGKSTLLKLLSGVIPPDKGKITVCGRVGALIELGAGFHPMLSGRENIYINGSILGLRKKEIDKKFDDIVAFAELENFIDTPVKFYSSGMYVRLGFAVAAHLEPDVLLVDEVLAVGDVSFRLKCFNHVRSLKNNGVSVILVSHNIADITRICDRGVILHKGGQVYVGNISGAIRCYQKIVQTDHALAHKSQTGPVKLTTVVTLNTSGEETDHFNSREDVLIHITYQSEISAPDSVFLLKLASQDLGEFVSFTNRVAGQRIPIFQGRGQVCVRLRNLPLMAGNYTIQVHLYNEATTTFWDQAVPACSFDIVEPTPEIWKEFHPIRIQHDWLLNVHEHALMSHRVN